MTTGNLPLQAHGPCKNDRWMAFLQMSLLVVLPLMLSSASAFAFTSRSATPFQRGVQFTSHHRTVPNTALMISRVDESEVVSDVAESVTVWTLDEKQFSLDEILRQDGSSTVVLSCLSHFGDFNAWELTQQYTTALKPGGKLSQSNTRVVLVGIGSVASAQKFAQDLDLDALTDRLTLVADPEGSVTEALGCYKGWLAPDTEHRKRYPQADVSPYLKLLGMIFGFGSPGTITKVLYGYLGDSSGSKGVDGRTWVVDGLLQGSSKGRFPKLTVEAFKDTPATSSLRPFELATLRLQTGLHIVLNWGSLGPKNTGDLFTRMGGTFVLDSDLKCVWSYFDQGILTYADLDEVCKAVNKASISNTNLVSTTKQEAADRRAGMELASDEYSQSLISLDATMEDSISADHAPEVDLGLEDLEEAILEELHEEAVVELEAAMEEESDEEGIRVDFLFEQEVDQSNRQIETEEAVQAKELFLRSLLQARLQYAKSAQTLPKVARQTLLSSSSIVPEESPKAASSTSVVKDQATTVSTSGNASLNREVFQRNLLKAQYKYKHFQPSKNKSPNNDSFVTNPIVNGLPSAPVSEGQKKELFQRALLQSRIQNERH